MDLEPASSRLSEKKDEAMVQTLDSSTEVVHLERRFSFLATLGLGFSLLNSWTAMSASLPVGLPSGGSVAMVWGLLVATVGTLLMGVSLAEICHVFPTSGGQYDWTYCIAPKRYKRGLSFFVGWMACAGWTSFYAAASSLGSGLVTGTIMLWQPDLEIQRWQTFLCYLAFILTASTLNTYGVRILPWVDKFAGVWGMAGIVICSIVLLACATPTYQKPRFVFAEFTNLTGWPDGFAFILGLLQSTVGLTAFDAASHLVEEVAQPSRVAPRVMVMAIAMGAATSWVFMVVLLFCLRDFEAVLGSPNGALLEIYYQVLANRAGATCLLMFNLVSMYCCVQAVNTISSRMTLSFARDRGFGPVSAYIAPIHPRLKVPVWSIVWVSVWCVIFGLIYLGSSVALNAILSAAILFIQTSYAIPILLMFIRGESAFAGHSRSWSLGKSRRWINAGALVFNVITSVCFIFPPALPVTGTSMNYAVVVFAVVLLMTATVWLVDGRKNFEGPSDIEERIMVGKNA